MHNDVLKSKRLSNLSAPRLCKMVKTWCISRIAPRHLGHGHHKLLSFHNSLLQNSQFFMRQNSKASATQTSGDMLSLGFTLGWCCLLFVCASSREAIHWCSVASALSSVILDSTKSQTCMQSATAHAHVCTCQRCLRLFNFKCSSKRGAQQCIPWPSQQHWFDPQQICQATFRHCLATGCGPGCGSFEFHFCAFNVNNMEGVLTSVTNGCESIKHVCAMFKQHTKHVLGNAHTKSDNLCSPMCSLVFSFFAMLSSQSQHHSHWKPTLQIAGK